MDNLTHSLAGLVLAEGAVQLRRRRTGVEPSRPFRAVAAFTSVVAANLPDFDLLYTGVGADRLLYMVHHRGHTHTVALAVVGAVLLWGLAAVLWRRFGRTPPEREGVGWLGGLLLVATLSHIALDWTNSYGVHPFWPVDNRWRYGDAVFIIEPWFWVVSVPMLFAATTRRIGRGVLGLLLLMGLVLAWVVPLVSTGAAAALTVGAAVSIALARALRPGPRVAAASAAWAAVTLVMGVGSTVAHGRVRDAIGRSDPSAEVLDVIVSPLPANPVCMAVVTVERSGTRYRVATARVSTVPSLTPAERCPSRFDAAPVPRRPSSPGVHWDSEWAAPHTELTALARGSCPARAALQFIRAPIWRMEDDSTVTLGDARFGGLSAREVFTLRLPQRSADCLRLPAPWVPPRADLLGLPASVTRYDEAASGGSR